MLSSKPKTSLAITILLVMLTFQTLLFTQAEPVVSSQLVDEQGVGGKIFFDAQNNPHILYMKETISDINDQPQGIYYAKKNGQHWDFQKIKSTTGNIFIMDTNNKPHIINLSEGTLKDYPLDTDWNINDYGISTIAEDNMALDTKGNLYQIYINNSNINSTTTLLAIGLAVWTKTGVTHSLIEQIVSNHSIGLGQGKIAVSPDRQIHVIYVKTLEHVFEDPHGENYLVVTRNLKYAIQKNADWVSETIATNISDINEIGNLVLDSKELPHLCYYQSNRIYNLFGAYSSNNSLKYTFYDGSKWIDQTIETLSYQRDGYNAPILRLDFTGNPQVYYYLRTYQPTTSYNLVYARYTGNAWDTQTTWSYSPNSYGVIGISNVAFDSDSNPHFTYQGVMGTYRSAYRYGNLTYVSLETPLTDSPFFVPAVACVLGAVVITILINAYRLKKKRLSTP